MLVRNPPYSENSAILRALHFAVGALFCYACAAGEEPTLGDSDPVVAAIQERILQDTANWELHVELATHLRRRNRLEEAASAAEKALALAPQPAIDARLEVAKLYAVSERTALAIDILNDAEKRMHEGVVADEVKIAEVYAIIGDTPAAFRWLDRAVAVGSPNLATVAANPDFDSVHDDPRWATLLSALKMPRRALRVNLTAILGDHRIELSADSLPHRFSGARPEILSKLQWQNAQSGLAWAELRLTAGQFRVPVRAIVVRINPRAFEFQLKLITRANGTSGAWNVGLVERDVAFATNAGQFTDRGPWGWLVINGDELRDPGFGPLTVGVAFDTTGALRWIEFARLAEARKNRAIRHAFQSYPLLLRDRQVPHLLLTSDDLDRGHRDARLILGEAVDSSLLVVLTRYDALGELTQRMPIGLTAPESVMLLGALGARHAVMLDGGVSAQMLFREATGEIHKWRGMREVPLALTGRPRQR